MQCWGWDGVGCIGDFGVGCQQFLIVVKVCNVVWIGFDYGSDFFQWVIEYVDKYQKVYKVVGCQIVVYDVIGFYDYDDYLYEVQIYVLQC